MNCCKFWPDAVLTVVLLQLHSHAYVMLDVAYPATPVPM